MLSYRHGFHAGNPADVFKHSVLIALVDAMLQKPKGIQFFDTHAGPALYDLTRPEAQKNREFDAGIGRLWHRRPGPHQAPAYLEQVRALNPDGRLRWYPGSPMLLRNMMRPVDHLILCELHPAEQQVLRTRYAGDPQVTVHEGSGYPALARYLPPYGGRGMVLIDPPYELKSERDDLTDALRAALKRHAHGVYALWYPLIEGRDDTAPDPLPHALNLSGEAWLDLRVAFPSAERLGRMHGCGMAIINCPWRAREPLLNLSSAWR
ncbi:MAG: 23S rRNA (adenine(2030)-N(6))-methyltransferase RlmJ [Wenzhouxiangellaceae bacterium]